MDVYMPDDLFVLYTTGQSHKYGKVAENKQLLSGFIRAVQTMEYAGDVSELKKFSYLHYEQLRYEYAGYSSVRLSNSYVHRLIFKEIDGGIQVELLEIDDTHYGNKR